MEDFKNTKTATQRKQSKKNLNVDSTCGVVEVNDFWSFCYHVYNALGRISITLVGIRIKYDFFSVNGTIAFFVIKSKLLG